MTTASTITVGRSPTGYWVKIVGRGTLRESPAVSAFVERMLSAPEGDLVVDLTACEYLDSTFLGCLIGLDRRFGHSRPPRFAIVVTPEGNRRILAPSHIDALLNLTGVVPLHVGEEIVLSEPELTGAELGHHVLEAHRNLAALGGRNEAVYRPIIERLARELERARS